MWNCNNGRTCDIVQVSLIQEKQCELVYCGRKSEYIYPNSTIYKDILPDSRLCGDMHKLILLHICCTTSTILVLRQALIDINFFDENLKFWQEYELTIRLAQRQPFYFVNEVLCVYRVNINDTNRLTNKYFEWRKAVKYIHNKHKKLYKNLTLKEKIISKKQEWSDAEMRCQASHLTLRKAYYSFLMLPFRVRYFFQITRYKLFNKYM